MIEFLQTTVSLPTALLIGLLIICAAYVIFKLGYWEGEVSCARKMQKLCDQCDKNPIKENDAPLRLSRLWKPIKTKIEKVNKFPLDLEQ